MFLLAWDQYLDSLLIEFEGGTAAYAVELDDNRVVDYSSDPEHPIGICLHQVSEGVVVEGLPHSEKVARILGSLDIPTK
jgi:hypothetical protein